ncbi:MAG: YihY/virulence factor BrkB family protein [Marinilabiliaceae bacterium]|jgi:membrane protein|nr:YihY/virulence factor BrkB family protein [Marinilabiliaceae bacterium]
MIKLTKDMLRPFTGWIKKLVLPGFDRVPIYYVISFFLRGFKKGALVTRASSIAFNLMLALLPSSFFLFTLIPFIPIPNFQTELIRLFENIVPENAYILVESTIIDVITTKSGVFLVIMFFASAIMSSNGIHALIHAFVVSDHQFETRSWVAQRRVSFSLLLIVVFLIALSALLLIFGRDLVQILVDRHILRTNWVFYIIMIMKWILIIASLFLAISFLYYLAPSRKAKFRFFSAGATLATLLFIATSLGFSAYVNNFDNYNKLYGSMGTILVILLWLYLNSISLLIGFELNASIKTANISKENELTEN